MSRCYAVPTAALAVSASASKTVIELAAASTIDADIIQCSVSFDASTPAAGVGIELVRWTTTGTGTTFTPLKYTDGAQARAALITAKVNNTVEPTGSPVVVESYYLPNTAGQFWQLPLGRELYIPVSTILGLRYVSAAGAAGNLRANILWQE